MLGGEIENKNIKLVNDDNFHVATEVFPYHHPQIPQSCKATNESECVIKSITVNENIYVSDNEDTGMQPVAASEMKAKLMSRESI